MTATVDPITVEIIRNALNAAADEMGVNLARSAYTPIIYEIKDYSVALFDTDCRLLGQAPGLPIFLGALEDAVKVGFGKLEGLSVTAGVQDFDFLGGSLGMAAGEAVIAGLETAAARATPFIMFAASGGARMQEGILSLMQLPRTTVAVQELREVKKPYIVVLTNPTTGGVTASYAMLGDVHIAEPGALIGFAGPRVIEQTIREKLPDGFQRAEYLKDHGMVDIVVHRHHLRRTLARLCRVLTKAPGVGDATALPPPASA